VVEGKWVVSAEWLTQSLSARFWINELPFEVQGDSVTRGGPQTARESIEKGEKPLFTNCIVYLYGDFQSPSKPEGDWKSPSKPELSKLLKLGGAEVSLKLPAGKKKKQTGKEKEEAPADVIVCESTVFSTLDRAEAAKIKGLGWTIADTKWILDCVSFYRILPISEYELG